jgi:hypothetical protein
MPAAHIDGTVRENSRNAAKMEVSTWMPNEARVLYQGAFSPVKTASNCTTTSR